MKKSGLVCTVELVEQTCFELTLFQLKSLHTLQDLICGALLQLLAHR